VATEKRVTVRLDPESRYQLIGFIDRIDKVGDGIIEIHDYKTAGALPSRDEVDADRQLALYQLAVGQMLPNVRDVTLIWHFLRFDEEIRSRRTPDQLEQVRAATIQRIQEIEAAESAGDFPATVSALCAWCPYQAICPQWKHEHDTRDLQPAAHRIDEGVALVNQLTEITAKRRQLRHLDDQMTAEIGQIEAALIGYAQRHGVCRVFGSDRIATLTTESEWRIPTKTETPTAYGAMVARLQASPFWYELTDFSRWQLIRFLDTPEGENLRTLLEGFVRKEVTNGVSLRRRRDDD
jgi:putative RecB family exonuclease